MWYASNSSLLVLSTYVSVIAVELVVVILATVVGASVTTVVDSLVVGDVGALVVGDVGALVVGDVGALVVGDVGALVVGDVVEAISDGEEMTEAEVGSDGEVGVVCEVDASVVEVLEDPSVCEASVSVIEADVGVVEL